MTTRSTSSTDMNGYSTDVQRYTPLHDSPYTPIISNHLRSSPILLQELQELYRIRAAEHLADTLWMRLHRSKAFDLLGHLRRRPNHQVPGTQNAAHTVTEVTDSMPHHEGKAKALTSVLPSTRSSLRQSYFTLGFYAVLSRVAKFPSNLTVKED
jgi:hypothetical protein